MRGALLAPKQRENQRAPRGEGGDPEAEAYP